MPESRIMSNERESLRGVAESGTKLVVGGKTVTRPEERLLAAVSTLSEKMAEATTALQAAGSAAAAGSVAARSENATEYEHRLRALVDDLQDAEAECEALWQENERLKTENANLLDANGQLDQALLHVRRELDDARRLINAMESTRGWRFLNVLRRMRNAARLRRPQPDQQSEHVVDRAVAAYSALDEEQAKAFRRRVDQ